MYNIKLPVTPLLRLKDEIADNQIYIKREDLLPFSFGGNKVRIASEFLSDMYQKNKNCIIGYGNARSNLNRALANLCCMYEIPCHIISPADDDGSRQETSNSKLTALCHAVFHKCEKTNVAFMVKHVMEECKASGCFPYYIYGNEYGKGNETIPVRAYQKVYREIIAQSDELGMNFDYIFLATGTGMTQSGLLAGQMSLRGGGNIIGISVAREKNKAEQNIYEYLSRCRKINNRDYAGNIKIEVTDDYLCGGYGKYNENIQTLILEMFRRYGIPFDPTYTGKAFYGMTKYLQNREIKGKNILFIHTGGTPLFFDYLLKIREQVKLKECKEREKLFCFLKQIDGTLPVPLSERVNLRNYAEKVLQFGQCITIEESGNIVAAVLFYCNDFQTKKAYITLLGTLPEYEGKGYATKLLKAAEEVAGRNGMRIMNLETERTNQKAISLYCKCGYQLSKIDNKVHMMKEI